MSTTLPGVPMVRALFRSIPVPGEGLPAITARLYYPAVYTGSDIENNTGALPAAPAASPWPVAILMPGINVGPESYGWLAVALAKAGFVTLSYGWILEEMPGLIAQTPGLDIAALKPESYGQQPSATALAVLMQALANENSAGPLAGRLDLNNILLGGHSAGGSVALFNARPDWFPGLKAVFAYGAHSKASTLLGYAADTVLALPKDLPTLVMGGSEDGVIAASAFRYGDDGSQSPDPIGPLRRTFNEGLARDRGDTHLAILRGANHFSACWPQDGSTGRPFLDWPETRDGEAIRQDMAQLVTTFARQHVGGDAAAAREFDRLLQDDSRLSLTATR